MEILSGSFEPTHEHSTMLSELQIIHVIEHSGAVRREPYAKEFAKGEMYGYDPARAPSVGNGDVVLMELPGRVLKCSVTGRGVCYRAYYFRVVWVPGQVAVIRIKVRHGGGSEEFSVSPRLFSGIWELTDDEQYLTVYEIYQLVSSTVRQAVAKTAGQWERAVLEKRVRTKTKGGIKSVVMINQLRPPEAGGEPTAKPISGSRKRRATLDHEAEQTIAVSMAPGALEAFL